MMFLSKHKFDLKYPEVIERWSTILGFKIRGIDYTKYHCINCDYTLSLDRRLMNNLPRSMKYGCSLHRGVQGQEMNKITNIWLDLGLGWYEGDDDEEVKILKIREPSQLTFTTGLTSSKLEHVRSDLHKMLDNSINKSKFQLDNL